MADLSKFTNDEQIILIITSCVEILLMMVSEMTEQNIDAVRKDVVNTNTAIVGLITDEEAKRRIKEQRRQYAEARKSFEQELDG